MSEERIEVGRLGHAISSCDEVIPALRNSSHPCHQIVNWQAQQWSPPVVEIRQSRMHRPEAWTGDLTTAPIVFLSSNPSFDAKENFPDWNSDSWKDEAITDFAINRFSFDKTRKYGATESLNLEEKDLTIAKDGKRSGRINHWKWVRRFAATVLGKAEADTSAISDYVMTEIVHCKSTYEFGVSNSLNFCKEKWFEKTLSLSPAKLIFVAGIKTGKHVSELYKDQIPQTWGSWAGSFSDQGRGSWPKTKRELDRMIDEGGWNLKDQLRNSVDVEVGKVRRTFIYIARPGGGGGLYSPWNHPQLLHPDLIAYWRTKLGN